MLKNVLTLLIISLLFFQITNFSQNLERKDVDQKYKWNLNDLYSSKDEWGKAKDETENKINEIAKYKGKLDESASNLLYTLKTYFDTYKELSRVYEYANDTKDQNLNISSNDSLFQLASSLETKFSEISSFMSPEILKMDPKKIDQFYKDQPELKNYSVVIENIQRLRDHTLNASEEQILASFNQVTGTMENVFGTFNNAEMPFAKVTLSDGKEVDLTSANYTKYRSAKNSEDRAKIFEAFFNNYGKFKNTIGLNLAGKVRADWVYAKDKKYKSSVAAALDNFNVPTSVYENLISQINKNLPTLYRFLKLKKKMLGVDTLHYYDLYTPLVKKVDMSFTINEGQKIILDALKPLGKDYEATLQKAFNDRWIDYMPTTGKRSGAYSTGRSYDVHPFILMNWTDDWRSVSTLAHELGHTMHSYYSNKTQPFQYSDYPIFVAEIASTCNETLLNNYMVNHVQSKEEKLYLLGSYLELLRQTIFRQTSFAEFELDIHKRIESNEPLNGEIMSNIYYDIVKRYYGNDEGICKVDDYVKYEWEYIPHFYYNFYVYQYATSLIYATAFAQKITDEGQSEVDKYYNILKGGSSDYPLNLIKKAGIDPLSSEAFDLTMKKMNEVMDEMEAIMNKK